MKIKDLRRFASSSVECADLLARQKIKTGTKIIKEQSTIFTTHLWYI